MTRETRMQREAVIADSLRNGPLTVRVIAMRVFTSRTPTRSQINRITQALRVMERAGTVTRQRVPTGRVDWDLVR